MFFINIFNISVIDDEVNPIGLTNAQFKIVLLIKYEHMHLAIYIDDKLTILDSTIDGNYIVFDAFSNDTYYLLDENFANVNSPYFIVTIVVSCLAGMS